MRYRSEIDGLRALAVIPVILFHAGFKKFSGGFVGVDIFFVISGFLITSIILNDIGKGSFRLTEFYRRRARRILPALLFVMLACIPFSMALMLPPEISEFSKSILSALTFTSNIFFWLQTGYFEASAETKPLLHTWSLSVEEQYYIFFPMLMVLLSRLGKKYITPIIVAIFAASLVYSALSVHRYPEQAFFLLPSRAWEILAGALCAILATKHEQYFSTTTKTHQILSGIGLLSIVWSISHYKQSHAFPGLNALVPVIGTALILLYARSGTLAARILSMTPIVFIGLISYSAYLWHQPIFAFSRIIYGDISNLGYLMLTALTLAAAYLTWLLIETPFRRPRRSDQISFSIFGAACAATAIIFCASAYATSGFLNLYNPSDRSLASVEIKTSGDYVRERFTLIEQRGFLTNSDLPKLLIIGDSFAQDIVNALHETGSERNYNIAVRHIKARCGNLFIEKRKIDALMPKHLVPYCQGEEYELYTDHNLKSLMRQADVIWLVSAWKPWQASVLPESIENIVIESGKTPLVFGTKNFGEYNIRDLLKLSQPERIALAANINEDTLRADLIMKSKLNKSNFVDVLGLLCPKSQSKCNMFNEDGELISPDGYHLTKEGAIYMGEKLKEINVIKPASNT